MKVKEIKKKYVPKILGRWLSLIFVFHKKKALYKAYLLFSTPRKGKILPDQEYFLEEAEDEIIQFNNLQLQTYRWAGTGETILMVHGWESNTHRWKILTEKLHQQNYNIIAFDAPAHGQSSGNILHVPLYADCLQKVIELYRPNHIIGHSVGGMTAIFHQYKFSESEIEKLIILAPPAKLAAVMTGYQKTLNLSDSFMKALDSYFKTEFGFYFEEFSLVEFVTKLDQKGLLIHDQYDKIAPYTDASEIAANWKNSKFVTTEHFGHSLFFDEVDDMIINFLKDEE